MIQTQISEELLGILTPYSDWFFKQDLEPLNELAKNNPIKTYVTTIATSKIE